MVPLDPTSVTAIRLQRVVWSSRSDYCTPYSGAGENVLLFQFWLTRYSSVALTTEVDFVLFSARTKEVRKLVPCDCVQLALLSMKDLLSACRNVTVG